MNALNTDIEFAIQSKLPYVVIKILLDIKKSLNADSSQTHLFYFYAKESRRKDTCSSLQKDFLKYLDTSSHVLDGTDLLRKLYEKGTHVATGLVYGSMVLVHLSSRDHVFQKVFQVKPRLSANVSTSKKELAEFNLRADHENKLVYHLESETSRILTKGIKPDFNSKVSSRCTT